MKYPKLIKFIAGSALSFGTVATSSAQLTLSVDMDTVTPGIQSSISVLPGAAFSVDLWATVGPLGLSSFSISTTFDTTELQLNPPGGPAASQPALPGGLANFPPVPAENNALGQVYSFQGGTAGAGPINTSFIFGSIAFTAPTPVTNAVNDVNIGYFNAALDDAFDNTMPLGVSYIGSTTFNGGKVDLVPEPASGALLALGAVGLLAGRRKRTR